MTFLIWGGTPYLVILGPATFFSQAKYFFKYISASNNFNRYTMSNDNCISPITCNCSLHKNLTT